MGLPPYYPSTMVWESLHNLFNMIIYNKRFWQKSVLPPSKDSLFYGIIVSDGNNKFEVRMSDEDFERLFSECGKYVRVS